MMNMFINVKYVRQIEKGITHFYRKRRHLSCKDLRYARNMHVESQR